MNITRNGKIARLPRSIRDLLNRRLDDGEPGCKLVAWLNALPEVRALLAAEFGGVPITEANLSRWKKGGYHDWLAREETRAVAGQLVADAPGDEGEGHPPLTKTLTQWVAAHYAVASRRITEADGEEAWRLLREMCDDVVQLRRRDQAAERLDLARARLGTAGKPGRPPEIMAGLDALLECSRGNPQAQAVLDELITLAHRSAAHHEAPNSPSPDAGLH